jgi:NADH:ubiquinone oxidoreductase subunit
MVLKKIKQLLQRSFTWWNGQTVGTWLYTKRFGNPVGSDSDGNIYYQNKDKTRRWVIYPTISEATKIPPDWHAWIHKMVDIPPSQQPFIVKSWEKPHQENFTGTQNAYTPPASLTLENSDKRRKASGDYEAWTPNK